MSDSKGVEVIAKRVTALTHVSKLVNVQSVSLLRVARRESRQVDTNFGRSANQLHYATTRTTHFNKDVTLKWNRHKNKA